MQNGMLAQAWNFYVIYKKVYFRNKIITYIYAVFDYLIGFFFE